MLPPMSSRKVQKEHSETWLPESHAGDDLQVSLAERR